MARSQFSNVSNRQRMKRSSGGWGDEEGSQSAMWGTENGRRDKLDRAGTVV